VREYQCIEDEGEVPCEEQDSSNMEITQPDDAESMDGPATLVRAKRRGWGFAILGAVQNAVPKRYKEGERPGSTLPRKSFSLSPLRLGHQPPGLKTQGSRENAKWKTVGDNRRKDVEML